MIVKERIYSREKKNVSSRDVLEMRITLEVISTNKKLGEKERNLLEYARTFFLFRRHISEKEEGHFRNSLDKLKVKIRNFVSEEKQKALHSLIIDAENHARDYSYKNDLCGLYDRINQKLSSL